SPTAERGASLRRLRNSRRAHGDPPPHRRRLGRHRARSHKQPALSRLLLASASPRRQALIGLLGLEWQAAPANVDEDQHLLGDPLLAALNVALVKARSIDRADEVIVAADTVVALDRQSLGKPSDAAAAHDMLRQLRGRPHNVLTGVVLR